MNKKSFRLILFASLILGGVVILLSFRVGQGDVVSLGDLSAKRLFKSLDRAPEATVIAWGIVCAMLIVKWKIWRKS